MSKKIAVLLLLGSLCAQGCVSLCLFNCGPKECVEKR